MVQILNKSEQVQSIRMRMHLHLQLQFVIDTSLILSNVWMPFSVAFQTTFQNIDQQLVTVETARMIRKWFLYMFQLSYFTTL